MITLNQNHLRDNESVFDQFKNIDFLEDEHCLKITGWSKDKFVLFSRYITSINNSIDRTKEELIAIYRYWLRKGIDQSSLSLLKGNADQRDISRYLSQIRGAILKDFVPFFLGAQRSRKFYLNHNNTTVKTLHNLRKSELALVADGTYVRIEKSSNNDFQYNSWSGQKKDSLIKPFIICCADGYFVDCYGPFKANQNDATIFDYILKNDMHLRRLIKPGKTVLFVDRGFLNIVNQLKTDHNVNVQIPTCKQLEQDIQATHKLSPKQASNTRLVTKCRYIIEKQNGILKNYKALDNIRNSQVGHIHVDYRIACAMTNFTHVPSCPDGNRSLKVAKDIRRNSLKEINKLEFLLSRQLDTQLFPMVMLDSILDFPKLSKQRIMRKVFFGSYQIRQCKSYLSDFIVNGQAYYPSGKLFKKIDDPQIKSDLISNSSRILAVEINSRHQRGEVKQKGEDDLKARLKVVYKVFIKYKPFIDHDSSIEGYICSCLSGSRLVGCCVHVATSIYYLSYAKYHVLKLPADELNSVFINTKTFESPVGSKITRLKRSRRESSSESDLTSSSESESETTGSSESDFTDNETDEPAF